MAKAEKAAKAATESFSAAAESFFKSPFSAFEFPKADVPAAYREFAEKGLAQAKQGYERAKAAAEEASELVETTYATASKGASTYNLKVIEVARANVNAHFDFVSALLSVKSPTEVAELTQSHAKKAFETYVAQTKELTELAKKVSTETVEPIKAASQKAFRVTV